MIERVTEMVQEAEARILYWKIQCGNAVAERDAAKAKLTSLYDAQGNRYNEQLVKDYFSALSLGDRVAAADNLLTGLRDQRAAEALCRSELEERALAAEAEAKKQREIAHKERNSSAEFIDRLAAAEAKVAAVRKLHKPKSIPDPKGYGVEVWCPECKRFSPCPTIQALDREN